MSNIHVTTAGRDSRTDGLACPPKHGIISSFSGRYMSHARLVISDNRVVIQPTGYEEDNVSGAYSGYNQGFCVQFKPKNCASQTTCKIQSKIMIS